MAEPAKTEQKASAKRTTYAVANITPVGTALNAVLAFVEAVSRSAGYEPSLHCSTELEAAKEAISEIGKQSVAVHNVNDGAGA